MIKKVSELLPGDMIMTRGGNVDVFFSPMLILSAETVKQGKGIKLIYMFFGEKHVNISVFGRDSTISIFVRE